MIEPGQFALFVGAAWALIVTPGPDMLYVLSRGMAHGRRAGIVSAGGVIAGVLVHTTAAALGLTLIFQTSALAFLSLRYLGAAYLIYLGLKTWRDQGAFRLQTPTASASVWSLFWQGVLSNVLNPKVAVFFLAFLPQFVEPSAGPVALQIVWFGLCFIVATVLSFGTVALLAGAIGNLLRRSVRAQVYLNRLCGAVFAGLAVRLLTSAR